MCANCVKNCPNDSIRLTLRLPTKELWFIRKPKLEEAFLAVVIMGIVFVQNVTMLEVWKSMLAWLEAYDWYDQLLCQFHHYLPDRHAHPGGAAGPDGAGIAQLQHDTWVQNFTRFGYAIIPLDMAGHIGHNLFHLLAEGKSVFYTGLGLFGQEVRGVSPALFSTDVIQVLQFGLIALGVVGSIVTAYWMARRNFPAKSWVSFAPYAVLVLLLGAINIWLFILPMAMRM